MSDGERADCWFAARRSSLCACGFNFADSTSQGLAYHSGGETHCHPGRLLFVSRFKDPEVRLQDDPEMLGVNVEQMRANEAATIDSSAAAYPLESLNDLPSGDYYVQAVLNIYTEFHRADGHTIWAHMDQWEGQNFNTSPGNLYSEVEHVHLDAASGYDLKLNLSKVIPPVMQAPDTEWVKHV